MRTVIITTRALMHTTSPTQTSPSSPVCEQNSSQMNYFTCGFFLTLLVWELIVVKLRNFVIAKRVSGAALASLT